MRIWMRLPAFLRISLSPIVLALIALSVPLTVLGMELAVDDPDGGALWGSVMIVPPSVVGVYAVLEVVWRRLPTNRVLEGFRRILLVPVVAAVVSALTVGSCYALLNVARRAALAASGGSHHWYPAGEGNPGFLTLFGGAGIGMFAAFAAFMVVVSPAIAFLRPDDFIGFNYGPADEGREAGRVAVRFLSLVAACVVLAPGGFVVGLPVLGWSATVAGVALTVALVVAQHRLNRSPG